VGGGRQGAKGAARTALLGAPGNRRDARGEADATCDLDTRCSRIGPDSAYDLTAPTTDFAGHSGAILSARLDLSNGPVRAYALFAHCFTCSKDLAAELARVGVALLRFDFTGLASG
jgi:hypothetical protein